LRVKDQQGGRFQFVAPWILRHARLLQLGGLHVHRKKGLKHRIAGRNGASFDLIHQRLWVKDLELFLSESVAVGLVVLEVILSLPVLLDRFNAIASPGAMREWAMYPMREMN
jgi:hypothetical protein